MKRVTAIVLVYFFLLGSIGLVPAKHYCGDFSTFQGLEFSTLEKASLATSTSAASRPDADKDASTSQDEINLLQLDESLQPRSLVAIQAVAFSHFLLPFYAWILSLGDFSHQVIMPGHLPWHYFTHLRLRAFLQIFRN